MVDILSDILGNYVCQWVESRAHVTVISLIMSVGGVSHSCDCHKVNTNQYSNWCDREP